MKKDRLKHRLQGLSCIAAWVMEHVTCMIGFGWLWDFIILMTFMHGLGTIRSELTDKFDDQTDSTLWIEFGFDSFQLAHHKISEA